LPVNDRLYRSRDERIFAGVAGGVAERFDLDPSLVRRWVILMFVTGSCSSGSAS
jgi:phage shock protein PspC (stress-responsive transcriptional regulator)